MPIFNVFKVLGWLCRLSLYVVRIFAGITDYPKTILTLDPIGRQDHEGIVIQNIQDFLLQQPDQA